MQPNDKIDQAIHEMLSEADKAGMPWYMALFNPKLWEVTKSEQGNYEKCGQTNNEGGG